MNVFAINPDGRSRSPCVSSVYDEGGKTLDELGPSQWPTTLYSRKVGGGAEGTDMLVCPDLVVSHRLKCIIERFEIPETYKLIPINCDVTGPASDVGYYVLAAEKLQFYEGIINRCHSKGKWIRDVPVYVDEIVFSAAKLPKYDLFLFGASQWIASERLVLAIESGGVIGISFKPIAVV